MSSKWWLRVLIVTGLGFSTLSLYAADKNYWPDVGLELSILEPLVAASSCAESENAFLACFNLVGNLVETVGSRQENAQSSLTLILPSEARRQRTR